jgi:hypothetical protein
VGEELGRRPGPWGLRVRPPDVDARVVVGTADSRAAVRLDVDERRQVELLRPRPVARLPDREQLGQAAPVAGRQRRLDGVEGVRQRARDLVIPEVAGARLDIAVVRLEPLVVVRRDPVAQHVHGLWLAPEPDRQLLGDERVSELVELERTRDRVVIGDRHEVHPPPLGELVDLLGWRRALREPERPLDTKL